MRSLLFSQLSERHYSHEELGSIINTPVFRILTFAIDRSGPRFWFMTFSSLQMALFVMVTWATADRHNHGWKSLDGGINLRVPVSIAVLVIDAIIAIRELAQVKVYRDREHKASGLQFPRHKGWEHWFQCFTVYFFLLIVHLLSLPAWPVLMIMTRFGSTKACAQGPNRIPLSAHSGSISVDLTDQPF